MSDNKPYTLYGSYASYYTAKPRSYLRKKGIAFVECIPAIPRFRQYVRPTSGSHRIPQLEAPDGQVIQDSTEIFDYLEQRYPSPAARPAGVRQQWVCRLLEALIDPALLQMAWHFRWNFMDENWKFVGREFGRSFRPRGSDQEVDEYGQVIADRMSGYRSSIGIEPQHFAALDEIYHDVLDVLEQHFINHPYLFGGLPSIADHALMGPLFGHLARDPVPAMRMRQRSPRVYRWTEHMNTPEIVWPELFDAPQEYLSDDEIPVTTMKLLDLLIKDSSQRLNLTAKAFQSWVDNNPDHSSGMPINEHPEPSLGRAEIDLRGTPQTTSLSAHSLWVLQRAFDWRDALPVADQALCAELLLKSGGKLLADISLPRRLRRINNFLCVE